TRLRSSRAPAGSGSLAVPPHSPAASSRASASRRMRDPLSDALARDHLTIEAGDVLGVVAEHQRELRATLVALQRALELVGRRIRLVAGLPQRAGEDLQSVDAHPRSLCLIRT